MRKEQRVTVVLGAALALLGALAIAQRMGFGTGYRLLPPAPAEERPPSTAAPKVEAPKLPLWPEYGDLVQRPMFNEDRKPTPVGVVVEGAPEVKQLNVTLTGVILTNGVKLAMVRDNASGKSLRLRAGMALPGDLAAWKVSDVLARSAIFEAPGQGSQELKLQINDKGSPAAVLAPPVAAAQPAAPGAAPAAPATPPSFVASGQPMGMAGEPASANADEIRRRIEERRKQLREEAQRMSNQEQQKQ